MKSWKLLALCAFAAPLAFAAPNPARVPAEADLVIVGDRLDVKSESSAVCYECRMRGIFCNRYIKDAVSRTLDIKIINKRRIGRRIAYMTSRGPYENQGCSKDCPRR